MKISRNTLLLILCAVVVIGGAVYYFFFFESGTDPALGSDTSAASDAELEFIALVGQLDPIVFDTQLLSDPRFTSRPDIRTAIVPEAIGRTDPFGPL